MKNNNYYTFKQLPCSESQGVVKSFTASKKYELVLTKKKKNEFGAAGLVICHCDLCLEAVIYLLVLQLINDLTHGSIDHDNLFHTPMFFKMFLFKNILLLF